MGRTNGDGEVFGLDEDDACAGGDGHEEMRRGDVLPAPAKGYGKARRLLFVGCTTSLHIWDCTNLEHVYEVLNLSESNSSQSRTSWGRVRFAVVLPTPAGRTGSEVEDAFVEKRPLIGVVAQRPREEPEFLVYSLSGHKVTTTAPSPSSIHNHLDTVPQPVFALSGRLLAFASPPPRTDSSTSTSTSRQPRERTSTRTDSTAGSVGSIGAGVGGTVLSGLWSAGRGTYSAARTKMAGEGGASSPTTPTSVDPRVQAAGGGLAGMWFSKSAPAASQRAYADDGGRVPAGSFVTIVDLQSLLVLRGKDDTETKPETLAEFLALKRQAVSGLKFSEDGANIVVVPEDGQVGWVFAVRPRSKALRRLKRGGAQGVAGGGEDEAVKDDGAPWHMYDLRRGRTNAIIDGIDISSDGRCVAMGSRKRTIHVFATNPYGGKADEYSHTGGKVVNCKELQPLSTSLSPIVRLRATAPPSSTNEQHPPSLSFAFLNSALAQSHNNSFHPRQYPLQHPRPQVQSDILVFDETDSTLSLRRFFVDPKPVEQNLKVPGSVPGFGRTSICLTSRSSLGWMSGAGASPQATGQAGRTVSSGGSAGPNSSALSVMMEKGREIAGREVDVASWNLKRGRIGRRLGRP
ncbi:uncharacterized protein STEHIDRAFT_161154 [Stereum hirsutum FP-91666 SS1]|uniref:uncharacterized protein n=1 Tax=Stereum hirsutum (strain FP-91666) TaxID=721885 RepID=UPI000444A7DD|nr:uncharacterized protein STEHIDRAFT_161154 [Stereum hirsutum FP-91666 SS1]EIM81795.1 hypothetical protein STEHIDRAFT_161154 [Stereum hirsutum FP-91666 SS1]